jgi:hypothetical protein
MARSFSSIDRLRLEQHPPERAKQDSYGAAGKKLE